MNLSIDTYIHANYLTKYSGEWRINRQRNDVRDLRLAWGTKHTHPPNSKSEFHPAYRIDC